MKKIVIITNSDIYFDQRVNRTATTLKKAGYSVRVVGRKLKTTPAKVPTPLNFQITLLKLLLSKGFLFYLFFNIRIFFYLLFRRYDLICSNDLDTLPGSRMASLVRFKPMVYDSHELFPELPELVGKPVKKRIWRIIERIFLPGLKHAITVSDSIADFYLKRYGVKMTVVRNLPLWKEIKAFKTKQPTIIYQGALNKGRGIELAIDMMKYLNCYRLIIVGTGDIEINLRKRMVEQQLFDRIEFRGRLPIEELHKITCSAWLGLSLEEDMGLSYRYALPNKIFDYILAQTPVLVSNLPEMKRLVDDFGVGFVTNTRDPRELANIIANFVEDKEARKVIEKNLDTASKVLLWEKEEPILLEIFSKALRM